MTQQACECRVQSAEEEDNPHSGVTEQLVLLGTHSTDWPHLVEAVASLGHAVLYLMQSTGIQLTERADVWMDNVTHLPPVLPHNHAEVTCPHGVRGQGQTAL